jgi:glycosyltransferase involved in cell wall biosynthesis
MFVTLHGYDIHIDKSWWEAGNGGAQMRNYPHELLALAKEPNVRFLAVSKSIAEQAVRFGIPRDRIVLSYIGVDLPKFAPSTQSISAPSHRVLYVGRFVEKKGVSYLIEAIGRLSRFVPDVELVLVGEGPMRESLETQSKAMGGRFTFKGALPSEAVRLEMHKARVLCLPSITASNGDAEGLGLVLVEAQAAGVPVVTSARGGADEVVLHGVSGFRFPEKDVAAMALQLQQLLCDDNLLTSMSRAAIENATRRFDIRRCIDLVEDQYDKLLNASE